MTDKKARAFSPAGISSFFEICETTPDGKPILDLEKVGARGGGFGLQKGIFTEVTATESERNKVSILINGILTPKAQTTKTVVNMFLDQI